MRIQNFFFLQHPNGVGTNALVNEPSSDIVSQPANLLEISLLDNL